MGYPAAACAIDDAIEVVVRTAMLAAPPEQGQVADDSIDALVSDGGPGGQHLDLGVIDRAILPAEVPHRVLGQVQGLEHVLELHHRHQAQGTMHVAGRCCVGLSGNGAGSGRSGAPEARSKVSTAVVIATTLSSST
jgi:hypothetical protein